MTVKLYKNSAENNQVDKTANLELVATLQGSLRSDCSIVAPQLQIESALVPTCNYMYIQEFGRYYYIEDVVAQGKVWMVRCRCDVLMSFKLDILNTNAVLARNLKQGDKLINDGSAVTRQKPRVYKRHEGFKTFNFDSGSYVLAVAGGGGNV